MRPASRARENPWRLRRQPTVARLAMMPLATASRRSESFWLRSVSSALLSPSKLACAVTVTCFGRASRSSHSWRAAAPPGGGVRPGAVLCENRWSGGVGLLRR